jgi:hypothetical protein
LKERRRTFLYRLFAWVDQRLFRRAQDDALAVVDASPVLQDVQQLSVMPEQKGFSDRFSAADLETVRAADLDVLFRFGFGILRGEILIAAKHGIWSFHHGDPDLFRGSPPGFWEVMTGAPVMGSILQRLSEELDNGEVLYRSWSYTDPLSVHRTKQRVYWKSLEFALRGLRYLRETGELPRDPRSSDVIYDRPLYRAPDNRTMVRLLVPHAWRLMVFFWKKIFLRPSWSLFVSAKAVAEPLYRWKELANPRGSFLADPCLVTHEGKRYLFVEEFVYRNNKGRVSLLEEHGPGEWQYVGPVLEEAHHLSHPFIFSFQGKWYMIPESCSAGTVDVYESTAFPRGWKLQSHLFENIRAVDAVVHEQDGRFWLFMNVAAHAAASTWDELHAYVADSPFGPWVPQAGNPVVSDVRRSRPAGPFLTMKGKRYRPAQDCSLGYGSALRLQEVVHMDSGRYEERDGLLIRPDWRPGLAGIHSIDQDGSMSVVDALRFRPFWQTLV